MKKKYKIEISPRYTRYCYACGKKGVLVSEGVFDEKTGKPIAHYECKNMQCPENQPKIDNRSLWKKIFDFDTSMPL